MSRVRDGRILGTRADGVLAYPPRSGPWCCRGAGATVPRDPDPRQALTVPSGKPTNSPFEWEFLWQKLPAHHTDP